ncbi:hypothetical protein ABZW18_08465 [Streptomyces sp. NPDC004647]|uniref:hypothetical protein n=1 Tax=Streptomyces sp. NPDC004647 TaxID=3154671 RepID=UPI0033AC58B3
MRGANQSLVVFASSLPPVPGLGCDSCLGGGAGAGAGAGEEGAMASLSASSTGLRMTTGGMGLEPGMLIRIRVVSVVSVLGSSGLGASAASTAWESTAASCDGDWRDPYGGVPEG